MSRLKSYILILAGTVILIFGALWALDEQKNAEGPGKESRENLPNIIFVLADDLGWTDVNSFDPIGRTYYETPNIDELARQGIKFNQAYSNAANCSPTRAAFLSGQYYPRQPIYHVGKSGQGKMIPAQNATELPLEKITVAEALKEGSKYETGFIGKWHIGNPPETGPQQQGFDTNIGGYTAGGPFFWEGGYFNPNNNPHIDDAKEGEYLTDYLTRKAVDFIKDHHEDPFYLQLSYYTPHFPYQAPEALVEKYRQKRGMGGHDNPTYAAMIESLDRGVGKLMQTLKELAIEENTIVVFYSDNGGRGGYEFLSDREGYNEEHNITSNTPLKGGKGTFYEGGIRVPLIVRWPAVIESGVESEEPVIGIDFYPTFLEVAGVEKPSGYHLDGKSLVPLFKDSLATLKRNTFYWHFPGYPNNAWRTSPVSVIRSGRWKLLKFYETGQVELYNLKEDTGEENNLANEYPQVRDKLRDRLERWLSEVDAPLPQIKDDSR